MALNDDDIQSSGGSGLEGPAEVSTTVARTAARRVLLTAARLRVSTTVARTAAPRVRPTAARPPASATAAPTAAPDT